MGYIYVDTGAMYRAMAVYFVQNNVNPDDEREINAAVTGVNITINYSIEKFYDANRRIFDEYKLIHCQNFFLYL